MIYLFIKLFIIIIIIYYYFFFLMFNLNFVQLKKLNFKKI